MDVNTGGCACGNVRYEVQGALPDARACHCSLCRKIFGGGGSAVSWVEPDNFKWVKGEDGLGIYSNERGFGVGFCSNCGSTLCVIFEGDVVCITLGSLDGDPKVKIGEHIFVGSKASWEHIGGDAPQYDERPEETNE